MQRDPMRFPRSVRLPAAAYAERSSLFHVTINIHPQLITWPDGVMPVVWETLMQEREMARVEVVAACLMPDHLHVIVSPWDILKWLNGFKSLTTRRAWSTGHRAGLWQPGMWDRTIRNDGDLRITIQYVISNPVTAGLVSEPQDWPWTWIAEG